MFALEHNLVYEILFLVIVALSRPIYEVLIPQVIVRKGVMICDRDSALNLETMFSVVLLISRDEY